MIKTKIEPISVKCPCCGDVIASSPEELLYEIETNDELMLGDNYKVFCSEHCAALWFTGPITDAFSDLDDIKKYWKELIRNKY